MLTLLHLLRDRRQHIPRYQFAFKPILWAEAELANLKSALETQRAFRDAADQKAKLSWVNEATPKANATSARSAY